MSEYKIKEVESNKDLMRFIEFPDILYKDCKQYVPALHFDQKKSLTNVSSLKYCTRKMWLVLDGDKVVGRICGIINPRYNEHFGKKRTRFGWFDTINDIEVAKLLLGTAEEWARKNGMTEIHGPLYYNTLGKQGMLVEGFENIPPFNCIYNYPYYNDLVQTLGYEKECDWLQYKMISDEGVDERILKIGNMLKSRYKLHEGSIDKLKKDKERVMDFFRAYNDSFSNTVYNFIPFTEEEMEEEANSVMPFLTDKTSVVILDEYEELAGFAIAFPSMSKALQKAKGKLFPFGWFHLWRAMHNYKEVDLMLTGAVPKWQNTGISAVYHCSMSERAIAAGMHIGVANPQLESNAAVNIWAKYDSELYMRRRCYLKSL